MTDSTPQAKLKSTQDDDVKEMKSLLSIAESGTYPPD